VDSTTFRACITAALLLLFSFNGYSQPCPGFGSGNPANNEYTISFYNNGQFITSCDCQLTGGNFKCGNCLPASFTTYQYVFNGVLITCPIPVPLPVELTAFTATVDNGDVQLSWTTETEQDNQEFFIERSEDAIDYVVFGKVPGAGNSTGRLNYSVPDTDPLRGISYYRLSQRDFNGRVEHLAVVSVELSSTLTGTVIAPNPSSGKVLLQVPLHRGEQSYDVMICNALGEVVRQLQITEDTGVELTSGMYQVVMRSGSQTWSEKLVILN
jgi:hypothetical protein